MNGPNDLKKNCPGRKNHFFIICLNNCDLNETYHFFEKTPGTIGFSGSKYIRICFILIYSWTSKCQRNDTRSRTRPSRVFVYNE